MDYDDDLTMRLAGFMHIEPMQDLCEYLVKQDLDADTKLYVEQVQESLIEFEDLLDEIEDRELSMTVEETIAQLDVLASFFSLHALKLAKRARTMCRALNQDAYFTTLRRTQNELERAQQFTRRQHSTERECSTCGGCMVVRTRHVDGKPFWGCEHFPTCRRAFSMSAEVRAKLKI